MMIMIRSDGYPVRFGYMNPSGFLLREIQLRLDDVVINIIFFVSIYIFLFLRSFHGVYSSARNDVSYHFPISDVFPSLSNRSPWSVPVAVTRRRKLQSGFR